jgi:hypothetical protein
MHDPVCPPLRLAEAAGVLSLATDLAMGQPLEHGLRTAVLALRTAQAMELRRAALVHDIGRVAVPVSVWAKPGPLTRGEHEQALPGVVVAWRSDASGRRRCRIRTREGKPGLIMICKTVRSGSTSEQIRL